FEAHLVAHHGYQPNTLRSLREGDSYPGVSLSLAWSVWQARPAQTEQQLVAVPEGWKLVPIKPTKEMLAVCKVAGKTKVWDDMLAAAAATPTAPIAQSAPQPEQSGLVDMVRLALHNGQLVPDPEMDGSTEVFGIKIDDMEALEAALSAQGESHE